MSVSFKRRKKENLMLTQVIEGRASNVLTIEFMLGNLCNYKCSYCYPGAHEGTHLWPDVDIIIKNISHLFDVYKLQGKTKFELYIVGGEPTLWKDLPKFCNFLKNNYDTIIRMSTNGYRKSDWWKEHSKLFDAVEISVHHEFAKSNHIKEVGDTLYRENTNLVANVLMDPNHFDKCMNLLEDLKTSKEDWPIIAKTVHIDGNTLYTDSQEEYLKSSLKRMPNMSWWKNLKHNEEYETWVIEDDIKKKVEDNYLRLNGKNRFNGWSCNLGLDHLHISMSGEVTGKCGQSLYGKKIYYNLYKDNFSLVFNPTIGPVICTKDVCMCGFETNISKKIIPIRSQ